MQNRNIWNDRKRSFFYLGSSRVTGRIGRRKISLQSIPCGRRYAKRREIVYKKMQITWHSGENETELRLAKKKS